jgi:UDP-N-acetylglucosamine 4,6-dehydratase
MNILITGGTGTLGRAIVSQLLRDYYNINKIIVLSRGEIAQQEMKNEFPPGRGAGLRYFIGDVRDRDRLNTAFRGVDVVIHAAAIKSVDVSEYNPTEVIETNIGGTINVISAAVKNQVKKAILVSTDKAPYPTTLYGATKFVAERLFINANILNPTIFSCVRYGNVIGSRGSILPKWRALAEKGKPLPITHFGMTRFFWKISEAAKFILTILDHMEGGEIFIPKMKACVVSEMARGISNNLEEIGIRGYEKLHETLITEEELRFAYECVDHFIVYPFQHDWKENLNKKGKLVPKNFSYSSKDYCYDLS